jgi:hypothetical protein
MSLLTDLFEGNTGNLVHDITGAPASFARDIKTDLPETLGAAALVAAPFLLPELLPAAAGAGGELFGGAGAAAADLSAADAAFGAFDPAVFAAESSDVAAGLGSAETVAGTVDPLLADSSLALDTSLGAVDPIAGAVDSAAIDPALADVIQTDIAAGDPLLGFSATTDIPGGVSDTSSIFTDSGAFDPSTFDPGVPPQDTLALNATDTTAATPPATTATDAAASVGKETAALDSLATTPINSLPGAAAAGSSGLFGQGGVLGTGLTGMQTGMLALGAAPLALTLGMGQPSLPAAAQASQAQANQLSQMGLQGVQQANAGIVNPGQAAQLASDRADLTNQWLQTLKNQGVQDPTKDSRWPQIQQLIDQKITAETGTMLQQNLQTALAETGQAASSLNAVASMQMQSDQAFTNNLIGATKSLGTVAALSAGARPTVQLAA